MSKRQLKKYLADLPKQALEEQLLDLYMRFSSVKEYYDFTFNPKEDKLVQQAKAKISNEYFPIKRKKPKARRSVAQKLIKHYLKLGVEPYLVADVMLYNIEIAQLFSQDRNVPDAFYKSMLNSFTEAAHYISIHGMTPDFKDRILKVYNTAQELNWMYTTAFSQVLDNIEKNF